MDKIIVPLLHFGTIDFFIAYYHAKEVLIESDETFPKQTYRNRTTIQGSNKLIDISIPLGSKGVAYKDLKLPDDNSWQEYHLKCLHNSYSKSPYYEFYIPYFETVLENTTTSIFDLNTNLLDQVLKCIKLAPKHQFTETYLKEYTYSKDLREYFKPSKHPQLFKQCAYSQVFSDRFPFQANLSILDILFNIGPETILYLKNNPPITL